MSLTQNDTIAAIATPTGNGGVGIIRISGDYAAKVIAKIFVPAKNNTKLTHALMTPGHIVNPQSKQKLDFVLVVRFFAPKSFTGEDVVEIHAHGGRLNLEQILMLVLENSVRGANPGEFTLRAFLNGKIDLTQAEAIRELIESKTKAALNASCRHLDGEITLLCENLAKKLLTILAHVEALIDFPEEGLKTSHSKEYILVLKEISELLAQTACTYERGRLLHVGVETMIAGLPNVGKSSLLNRILGVQRAIVSDQPGTTRDLIEANVDIFGVPVSFVDSAGLRDSVGDIEAIGVKMALERLQRCDFLLWVIDSSKEISAEEIKLAKKFENQTGIIVLNKIDLTKKADESVIKALLPNWSLVKISAKSGAGMNKLLKSIGNLLNYSKSEGSELLLTSARHQAAFANAAKSTKRALAALDNNEPVFELLSADLHEALGELHEIVGITTPDDILNEIFSKFCIGK